MNSQKSLTRYFIISRVFLTLTPIFCLIYLNMSGPVLGANIQEMVSVNPGVTIMFLMAMLNPFAAYLLGYVQKRLDTGDTAYAAANLICLAVVEIVMLNVAYFILFLFLLYKVKMHYQISVKHVFHQYRFKKFLVTISGSLVMMPFAALCLFAQIQLGLF